MIVSDNIIIGKSIEHDAGKILSAIRRDKPSKNMIWYAVTTALEEDNLMYIISGVEYCLPAYRGDSLRVLGLAGTRKEAGEILLKLVEKGYNHNDICNMKHFLGTY